MQWNFLNEIGRKIIHITILLVLIIFSIIKRQYSQRAALLFIVLLLLIFIVIEYFRLELNWKMPFFYKFIRPKEQDRMYGVIYFLSATVISLAVFDFAIAIAALLMTTFGDLTAALVGKKYGTTLIFRNKTLIGFGSELGVNLIVGILISLFFTINIYVPIAMAFIATFVETLIDTLDDNLIVPLFTGFVGQILLFII